MEIRLIIKREDGFGKVPYVATAPPHFFQIFLNYAGNNVA